MRAVWSTPLIVTIGAQMPARAPLPEVAE